MRQVETLKAAGEYRKAGQVQALLGYDRDYGCHYGMRSTREAAIALFHMGYNEVHYYLTHGSERHGDDAPVAKAKPTLRYILTTNQNNHVIAVYDTEAKALTALDAIIRELIRDGYTYQRWTDKTSRNVQRVRAYRTDNKSPVLQYQLYIHKEG